MKKSISPVTFSISKESLDAFLDFVKAHGIQRRFSAKETLKLPKNSIGFVIDGIIGIYYKRNNKLVNHAFYGMPVIESKIMAPQHPFKYKIESETIIFTITIEKLFDASSPQASNNGFIFSVLTHQLIEELISIYEERHGGNGYHVAKELIYSYAKEKNVTQGLATYILKRTQLSNSYVFKILASLRDQGYITMTNGKLQKINKTLPDKV